MTEAKPIPSTVEIVEAKTAEVPATNERQETMLEILVRRNVTIEMMEAAMALQERIEATEARKEYSRCLAAFHADGTFATKDLDNIQYKSKYSSKGNIINTLSPALAKHGFTHRWVPEQGKDGMLKVTCILTHEMGHSESATLEGPPDKSGSKNALQQIKSTNTYLQIATFESVTGTASGNADVDDDGNSAVELITPEQVAELIMLGDKAGADLNKFNALFGITEFDKLKAKDLPKARTLLKKQIAIKAKAGKDA